MVRFCHRQALLLLLSATAGFSAAGEESAFSAADIEFFETKIRPVLVEHCYQCHSDRAVKADKLRGGLRLDIRAGLLEGGDSGPAIVPGEPAKSLLIESLKYESFEMPPQGKLPAAVIADFSTWILHGAADPRGQLPAKLTTRRIDIEAGRQHWAYRPLTKPPIPRPNVLAAETAIDAFVLRRLAASGLRQSSVADRDVLVRRLYFDLLGLPPTLEQIDAFVHDEAADAYERLVDRLLASPHFGERWGRRWLDVVRYAESITLRGFVFPEAWRYRDYVIETWNADRPFDQFIREQIAGDLLPATSLDERRRNAVATTFLTMGNNNLEDQDKAKLRMDVVDEQLETIGRGILAQTIGCARCHDHKFDPIPTRDYYALAGILRNTKTLNHANVSKWIEMPLPLDPRGEADWKKREAAIAHLKAEIQIVKQTGNGGGPLPVGQLRGVVVDNSQARLSGRWMPSRAVNGFIGEDYQHDLNEGKGEKTASFSAELSHDGPFEVRLAYTSSANRSSAVPVTVISGDGETTVTVNQKLKPPINGRFVSLGRYRFQRDDRAEVVVSNRGTSEVVIIDAVQFLPVNLAGERPDSPEDESTRGDDRKQRLQSLARELKSLEDASPARARYMSVQEESKIEDAPVHIRGDVHNLGPPAARGFLQVAHYGPPPALSSRQSGRRELADWLASRDNPLTARVLANRLWHWTFGAGLVRTTDNFGTTGQLPSHPELLDYLAARLLEQGWSIKSLLREIVLSRTYRSSSQPDAQSLAVDPDNRLLWRMNRRRLEAECLADSMLSISGQMRREFGGSTIRPGTQNDYNYQHDENRRAVYWPVFRNSLPDIFEVFDFANPSMVTGRRDRSSTARQALFLMNNPWVIRQSELSAARLLAEQAGDDSQRLQAAFRLALGRRPSSEELSATLAFLRAGDAAMQRQAWAQVVQTLFASVDFRYIE